MTDKTDKIRVSVTMTQPYIDALDNLVEEGLYLGRGEAPLAKIKEEKHQIRTLREENQS